MDHEQTRSHLELHDHCSALFIALLATVDCDAGADEPWWSRRTAAHDEMFPYHVVAGVSLRGSPGSVVSYHLAEKWVPFLEAAGIRQLEERLSVPASSDDVLVRLMEYATGREVGLAEE